MEIVDTHTHVISPDTARYPLDPVGGRQSGWSQEHPVDIDGLVRALDEAGIAKAVVVQASTVYGHDNRYVAEAVRAHPDRFVGVYSIDAMAADAVERIEHWQGQGLSGFRLFTTGTTMPGQADWLGHERSHPAWAHAEAHGIPVCLQMTIQGLPALRSLLERFPGVRVLLDHCARPDLADGRPYRAARDLFDLAAHPACTSNSRTGPSRPPPRAGPPRRSSSRTSWPPMAPAASRGAPTSPPPREGPPVSWPRPGTRRWPCRQPTRR